MISTTQEIYEYLREYQPKQVVNREFQKILPHRSPGAIGGALSRLSSEGVLEPVGNDGKSYLFAVRDLSVPLKFHPSHRQKKKAARNDGVHAKRRRFGRNERIRLAINQIIEALSIIESEL